MVLSMPHKLKGAPEHSTRRILKTTAGRTALLMRMGYCTQYCCGHTTMLVIYYTLIYVPTEPVYDAQLTDTSGNTALRL